MENKERVIVIDLVGDGEERVNKAEKTGGHECRCGVCNCHEKHEPEQLELQLQFCELSAPGAGRSVRGLPLVTAPALISKKHFKH